MTKSRNIDYVWIPVALELKHNIKVMDFRDEQPNPPPKYNGKRKHKIVKKSVVVRDPKDVDSITVHQTACVFGKSPHQETRYHRALGVACHALSFNDGVVALPNPIPWYVYHGNGFNKNSLGLEIEGSFVGCPDDPESPVREDLQSHWGDDSRITPLTELGAETACVALERLMFEAEKWGANIKYINAHRQSSATRRSDPGYEIWNDVVLAFAVKELGLKTQPLLKIGKGRRIPLVWDPEGRGKY